MAFAQNILLWLGISAVGMFLVGFKLGAKAYWGALSIVGLAILCLGWYQSYLSPPERNVIGWITVLYVLPSAVTAAVAGALGIVLRNLSRGLRDDRD